MRFRQTYKGIFQFRDQATLERAMAEIQAEAMGADALGLQECYLSPGVMRIDLDLQGSVQDWEEMAVAIATLAMHAGRGFCVATAHDGGLIGPRTERYLASGPQPPRPARRALPDPRADFFPANPGTTYRYTAANIPDRQQVVWTVRSIETPAGTIFHFEDSPDHTVPYDDYWEGAYYRKRGGLIEAVAAGNPQELNAIRPSQAASFPVVYDQRARTGDIHYAIWPQADHFLQFTVEGFEDLQLPIGSLKRCMRIRMDMHHVRGSEMSHSVQHQWFAPGIGLVKWQKGEATLSLAAVK